MTHARALGVAAGVLLYVLLPGRPIVATEFDSALIFASTAAAAAAITWIGLAALRAYRSCLADHSIALFFLARARAAHTSRLGAALLILLTPAAEELLFRGVLTNLTHPFFSVALFAVIHDGRLMRVSALCFGLAMEVLTSHTGSLAIPITIHTAVNSAAFLYFRARVRFVETPEEIRMLL